jgi:hypothetical protein
MLSMMLSLRGGGRVRGHWIMISAERKKRKCDSLEWQRVDGYSDCWRWRWVGMVREASMVSSCWDLCR